MKAVWCGKGGKGKKKVGRGVGTELGKGLKAKGG